MMSKEAMKLALEALENSVDLVSHEARNAEELYGKYPSRLARIQGLVAFEVAHEKAITALREALAEQPAQQEPKIDIYRSFEQWKSGNVLEHGVPRTEFYTKADLNLVEMGWRYGYDAGRAVEQALDKKAENARELGLDYEPAPVQEPVAKPKLIGWRTADFLNETTDIKKARSWEVHYEVLPIFEGDSNTKLATPPAAQRQWVGLTDEEISALDYSGTRIEFVRAIEAKLKEKNT